VADAIEKLQSEYLVPGRQNSTCEIKGGGVPFVINLK